MAKILVADDNSNVQKTVALALAGLGVEVVSVNNGEAAVRKLSSFSPDLVLADIFMPVRNGYEVCDYIKKDARFSRVPVVLLVGAFDPLDEREAQRVGADGILKKPFVPPDPLITMVKTLLDRTLGDRLVSVTVPAPAAAMQAGSAGSAIAEVHSPSPEIPEELPIQEFPSPAQRVAFGEGAHPVAFGTLLETPDHNVAAQDSIAIEPVDDEQILTSSRDATLGDPIFWKSDDHEQEQGPQLEAAPTRVAAGDALSVPEIPAWKQDEESLPRNEEATLLQPVETIELVHEELDETPSSIVDPASILQDAAAMATLNVESLKADDLTVNALEWMATAPTEKSEEVPEASSGWDEPILDATDTIDGKKSAELRPDLAPVLGPASGVHLVPDSTQVSNPAPTPILEHAEVPVTVKATPQANAESATSEPPAFAPQQTRVEVVPAAQSTEDTARSIPKKDWADLTASLQQSASKQAAQLLKSEPVPAAQVPVEAAGNSQAPLTSNSPEASPDAALVEAVVQRVLDKMRPQVVDIVTKEFLRPIVQALVHREIDKH